VREKNGMTAAHKKHPYGTKRGSAKTDSTRIEAPEQSERRGG